MKRLRQWIILTLFFTCTATSIQAHEMDQEEYPSCGEAYIQSSHTAHWSVYVPITILIAAAIYFGIADQKNRGHHHSSDSQDALGSIVNSKRIGSMKCPSCTSKCSNRCPCSPVVYTHS